MIISPQLLREQILFRILNMLKKAKESVVILEDTIDMSTWSSPDSYKKYRIVGIIQYFPNTDVKIMVRDCDDIEYEPNINIFNVEDIYNLYQNLSTIITVTPSSYIDTIEEA